MKNRDSTQEALLNKQRGDSEVNTSCIMCKFKPNWLDAVPFYISAADQYHGLNMWREELDCRGKLALCHNNLKSEWEEGNQYEKMANIYLMQLNDSKMAFQMIQNAYRAYFIKSEYKDAVNGLTNIADFFNQKDETDYAEKCLKIAYDCILQVFHTLATKQDEPLEFMYRSLDRYFAILFKNNKVRIVISDCESVLKVIQPLEENTSRIVHFYGMLLLALIVNEDDAQFKLMWEQQPQTDKSADIRFLENFSKVMESFQNPNEKQYKVAMIEINVDYPIEVCKKVQELFIEKVKNNKSKANNNVMVENTNTVKESDIKVKVEDRPPEDDYL
jgi:hypothetical protein